MIIIVTYLKKDGAWRRTFPGTIKKTTGDMTNVPNLIVSTAEVVPTGIKITTHMLSTIDIPLLARPNLAVRYHRLSIIIQ